MKNHLKIKKKINIIRAEMSNPGVLALSLSLVSNSASNISSFNTVLPDLSLLGLNIFMIPM